MPFTLLNFKTIYKNTIVTFGGHCLVVPKNKSILLKFCRQKNKYGLTGTEHDLSSGVFF